MTETGQESRDKARESRCPFCGANEFLPNIKTMRKVYECETEIEELPSPLMPFIFRGRDCLESEITRLKKLVREAIGGWDRAIGWSGKKYLPEYKKFINRPEVRVILREK